MLLVTFHRQHLFRGHKRELRLQRATLQMVPFLAVELHWAKAQVTVRNSGKWSMALSRHPGYSNQRQEVETWEILTKGQPHSCVRTALHVGAGGRSVPQRAVTRFLLCLLVWLCSDWQVVSANSNACLSLHWVEKNHQGEQTLLGFENYFYHI